MWRKWFVSLVVIALFGLATGTSVAQEKSYHAERFDVDVTVQSDGSLAVTETVVFRFVGEPFTFVFRELVTENTDGITDIQASVDGRVYPQGSNAGQVEISGNDPIRVTWHLEPTTNTSRTFTLSYRMLGVVQQQEEADLLTYQPLPDEYEYTIDSSTVTISYPSTADLQQTPTVTAGEATMDVSGNQVTFREQNLSPDETLVVQMRFAPGSLIDAPPAWQARQAQQNAWGPAWIGASLALLVLGSLLLIRIWRNHQPQTAVFETTDYEPPGDLPPGIAGALQNAGNSITWANALGTLFDLAERGFIEIEELDEKKWYRRHNFTIRRTDQTGDLVPHERGLLEMIFTSKKGPQDQVRLSDLSNMISGKKWKLYTKPLEEEMETAAYLSEQRQSQRRGVIAAGGFLLAAAIVALVLTPILLMDRFGAWPISLGFSLMLLAIIYLTAGSMLSTLSDKGARIAAEWKGFKSYLTEVSKGKTAVSRPDMFESYLPYAAGFGLLSAWVKQFEKSGWTDVPTYFQALPTSSETSMAAFVAMTAATSSSGGSAAGGAGAAGAGAAGGGASGAG